MPASPPRARRRGCRARRETERRRAGAPPDQVRLSRRRARCRVSGRGANGPTQSSAPRTLRLRHSFVPLPESAGNLDRQTMTELAGKHYDLPAMMAFMRDEVGQDMRNVQRQVAPDVGLRRRHMASIREAELEERFNPPAAPFEGGHQCSARDLAPIDRAGMVRPCSLPSVLSHEHLALWRCAAIMRMVRCGAPGTAASQSAAGRCSTRYAVTRLLVRQEARSVASRSVDWIISFPIDSGRLRLAPCSAQPADGSADTTDTAITQAGTPKWRNESAMPSTRRFSNASSVQARDQAGQPTTPATGLAAGRCQEGVSRTLAVAVHTRIQCAAVTLLHTQCPDARVAHAWPRARSQRQSQMPGQFDPHPVDHAPNRRPRLKMVAR